MIFGEKGSWFWVVPWAGQSLYPPMGLVGPVGIIITDAMLGEVTATIAQSVARAKATRILIPFNMCDTLIAGIKDTNTGNLINAAMESLRLYI